MQFHVWILAGIRGQFVKQKLKLSCTFRLTKCFILMPSYTCQTLRPFYTSDFTVRCNFQVWILAGITGQFVKQKLELSCTFRLTKCFIFMPSYTRQTLRPFCTSDFTVWCNFKYEFYKESEASLLNKSSNLAAALGLTQHCTLLPSSTSQTLRPFYTFDFTVWCNFQVWIFAGIRGQFVKQKLELSCTFRLTKCFS